MKAEQDLGADVRRIIQMNAPLGWRGRDLPDDLPLGSLGIGLDSISLVELLLACEEHFALPFPASLLDCAPLTVGSLVEHVRRERSGGV